MATYPRQTPQINAEGLFVLRPPFDALLKNNTIYTVEAIRTFQDLIILNENIFDLYYNPVGLTTTDYDDDYTADTFIVTLVSKVPFSDAGDTKESVIYVPDSYILSFPNGDNVNYFNFILALEMGPLPEWFDETELKNDIRDMVKARTGLFLADPTQPEVKVFRNSHPQVITSTNSALIEQARLAAVSEKDPTVTQLKMLKAEYQVLLDKYNTLSQYIINNP